MYLSRFFLNPASRQVRADVADPEGLHKSVMRLFPSGKGGEPRKAMGVLHRLDEGGNGRLTLLVQSALPADLSGFVQGYLLDLALDPELAFSGVVENASLREVGKERAGIAKDERFVFRLKANVTKKVGTKTGDDGKRRNGFRVPLRGDEAKADWLERHAIKGGFLCEEVRIRDLALRGREVRLGGVVFEGVLLVTDPQLFANALALGIGPAKAFGFGLLSILPLSRNQ